MYKLQLEKSRYYRVKRGQSAGDIERALLIPVSGDVYEGKIIAVPQTEFVVYKAEVGETYHSIAKKFCVDEGELKKLNGEKPVYPTCRLFIPR